MSIKKIPTEDLPRLIDLVNGAYPGMAAYDDASIAHLLKRFTVIQEEEPNSDFYGYYLEDQLIGAMRLYDYQMNLYGSTLSVGGVGLVAVDLLHKKEKVAKHLITYFISHYHERKSPITLLYPFRPDFYKKMGFGYGTKMDCYQLQPTAFRNYKNKVGVRFLTANDKSLVKACYTQFFMQHHGMIEKTPNELDHLFKREGQYVLGYEKDGRLLGYFSFTFKKAHDSNTMINDLHIGEWIILHTDALKAFSTFLHSQADQVHRIVLQTQDESFHFLVEDPRNQSDVVIPHVYHEAHTTGVGLMYRVSDVPLLFVNMKDRHFWGITCRLRLHIEDSFYPQNHSSTLIQFSDGKAQILDSDATDAEVTLRLDVSDFSSLIMGSVSFNRLYQYGLIDVSDESYLSLLSQLFYLPEKPICRTGF